MSDGRRMTASTLRYALACTALACLAGAAQARDDALYAAAQAEQGAVLDTLKQLVSIDSGTLNGAGVRRVADAVEPKLKALGFATQRFDATPSPGVNLLATLKGKGSRKVMLIAHMDTVYLDGTAAKQPFRIDGNRAYGAGIADDKGGMAVALHAARLIVNAGFSNFGQLTLLFNGDEERGSMGSRDLIRKLAGEHDAVLSFEGTGIEKESVRLGTSGITRVQVEIEGKASHAGAAPERGVNALVEAADLVLRTQDIDDASKGLRFNWTLEKAGEVPNIIPDKAVVEADVRYKREEDLEAALAKLDARVAAKRLKDAKLTVKVNRSRPAFAATDQGRHVAELAQAVYREIGLTLEASDGGGGGTDAAYAAQGCKAVVESMGMPGFGAHANTEEYVIVDRIPARLYLAARLVQDIAQGK